MLLDYSLHNYGVFPRPLPHTACGVGLDEQTDPCSRNSGILGLVPEELAVPGERVLCNGYPEVGGQLEQWELAKNVCELVTGRLDTAGYFLLVIRAEFYLGFFGWG